MTSTNSSEEDPHYFIIKGRRWRRCDPNIPPNLNQELVNALMNARRLVKEAKKEANEEALAQARRRVSDCKNALGERGPKWWEPLTQEDFEKRCKAAIFALLHHRGLDKTICPSEAAKITDGLNWRARMDSVRAVAYDLREAGHLEVTQKGEPVTPPTKGPIRLKLPR